MGRKPTTRRNNVAAKTNTSMIVPRSIAVAARSYNAIAKGAAAGTIHTAAPHSSVVMVKSMIRVRK